jgi:predicted DNA-binding ribbon-helix-helix protein
VHGHPTSIRLEPDFWQFLREIAAECGCTMRTLIDGIATTKNPKWPLTSALRLYIAAYFRNANGQYYMIVDQLRGTRKPRSQQRVSDSGRPPRRRAA